MLPISKLDVCDIYCILLNQVLGCRQVVEKQKSVIELKGLRNSDLADLLDVFLTKAPLTKNDIIAVVAFLWIAYSIFLSLWLLITF